MAKAPKTKGKAKGTQSVSSNLNVENAAEDKSVQEGLSILEKLNEWHERSSKTRWVIGEHLLS